MTPQQRLSRIDEVTRAGVVRAVLLLHARSQTRAELRAKIGLNGVMLGHTFDYLDAQQLIEGGTSYGQALSLTPRGVQLADLLIELSLFPL